MDSTRDANSNANTDLFYKSVSIGTLYVPDNYLSTYLADPLYASLANANKIKAISECPRITK
jgi:hypothetical protein